MDQAEFQKLLRSPQLRILSHEPPSRTELATLDIDQLVKFRETLFQEANTIQLHKVISLVISELGQPEEHNDDSWHFHDEILGIHIHAHESTTVRYRDRIVLSSDSQNGNTFITGEWIANLYHFLLPKAIEQKEKENEEYRTRYKQQLIDSLSPAEE
jgi:hypothetical protein